MNFANPYFSKRQKINLLERWILVHSFLYYNKNESFVDDRTFDMNSKQLAEMAQHWQKSFKQSRYYKQFKDFDGSSGYGLVEKLPLSERQLIYIDAEFLIQAHGGGK